MSKCVEAFKAEFGYEFHHAPAIVRRAWQAAWNARGKVDAEICKAQVSNDPFGPDENGNEDAYNEGVLNCAEAIEKENE